MAAAKPTEQLHAELECPICMNWYTDPVSLPCGHNFCRGCLQGAFHCRELDPYEDPQQLDCPVCRKSIYTNDHKLRKMPVNLKLRNIISAIREREVAKPTECETHKKPHVMYCHDCNAVKCLTCFTKVCKSHNTEEIDDMAVQVRSLLKSRRAEVEKKIAQLASLKEEHNGKSSNMQDDIENKLVFLLDQVETLKTDLLEESSAEAEKNLEKLKSLERSTNSKLIKDKTNIETMALVVTASKKHSAVESEIQVIGKDLQKISQKLKKILRDNGRKTEKKPVLKRRPQAIEGACGGIMDNSGRFTAATAYPYNVEAGDGDESSNSEYGGRSYSGIREITNADLSSALSALTRLRDGVQTSNYSGVDHQRRRVTSSEFPGRPFNSISYIPEVASFYVNTEFGSCRVLTTLYNPANPPDVFNYHMSVKDMCQVQQGKVLVMTADEIQIHRSPRHNRENQNPVFVLPPPPSVCDDGWSGVSTVIRDNTLNYCLKDNLSGVVHIWNPSNRRWDDSISVYEIAGSPNQPDSFAFDMCTTIKDYDCINNIIYFTLYYQGEIIAYDDKLKRVLWHEQSACHYPAGIAATNEKLLVCDAHEDLPCLVIMDLNGYLLQKLLKDYMTMNGPCWKIAVSTHSRAPQPDEPEDDSNVSFALWRRKPDRESVVDVFNLHRLLESR